MSARYRLCSSVERALTRQAKVPRFDFDVHIIQSDGININCTISTLKMFYLEKRKTQNAFQVE